MAKDKKEIAVVPQDTSAEKLIQQAISANVPVETLERLLAMRTQIRAEQAREAFNRALASFQAECPTIIKTKEVFTNEGRKAYKYAPIESIVSQVKPLLQRHGFSYTTQIVITEKGVKATCKVTHEMGHTEESSMEVPLGSKTKIMSDSQQTAAASTFAKRYAFCNALGLLTGDEDIDGAKFDTSPIEDKAVPMVVYDQETPKIQKPKVVADTQNQQKRTIKDLCDAKVMVALETAEEYRDYVKQTTNLDLIPSNYPAIIERLTALQ